MIGEEIERYRKMGIELIVDEETVEMLIRKGINKALGARPMKRTAQEYLGGCGQGEVKEELKLGRAFCRKQETLLCSRGSRRI